MRQVRLVNLTRSTVLAERADVAEAPAARRRGLLGTPSLPDGRGLVIIPCRHIHTMGMKYAIDVAFVDASWMVKRVVHNLKPGRLSPLVLRSRVVLELPAGKVGETRTEKGDMLEALPAD
jgi:uncharacterized membrane protein (UPF0127 family)